MRVPDWKKRLALLLLCVFCSGEIARLPLLANTASGGPGTPEVQSFQAADVTELVQPFTGDFSYNIPLLDVGGYPINLSYSSNVSLEQEASWVGLGWTLGAGSINRNVRGLPDDFNGDPITKRQHVAPNTTIGNSMTFSGEIAGAEFLKGAIALTGSQTIGFQYNNYMGWDYTVGSSNGIKGTLSTNDASLSGSLSLSSGYSRSSGNYLRPNFGLGVGVKNGESSSNFGVNLGISMSSREGLKSVNFGTSYSRQWQAHAYANEKKDIGRIYGKASGGHNFPLLSAKPTYVPAFDMPRMNLSGTFGLKIGGEVTFVALAGEQSGYFSTEYLKENRQERAAFGYLYAHKGSDDPQALMDMNREKDGPFQEKMPHLPIPSFTNDVYNVTGQGFQGQFRAFRSDIGLLADPQVSNDGFGLTAGADASFGNLVKAGVDLAALFNQGKSGKWTDDNAAAAHFQFHGPDPADPLYQPVYFKQVGEMTGMKNQQLFDDLGAFKPFNVALNGHNAQAEIQVLNESSTRDLSTFSLKRQTREPQVDMLSYLNAEEAMQFGLNKSLLTTTGIQLVDDINNRYDLGRTYTSRDHEFRQSHHLSEMTLTRSNGNRYIYGLPAYNISQQEVTFNAAGLAPTNGLVTYDPGQDNSPNNQRGVDHLFTQVETPAYAYAYHLTAVLSPDYVDLNGNGPTPDDLGTYTRFHYSKPHERFSWRMPFGANQAKFSEGHLSTTEDDKAHYVYGEKEIYYLKVIETRNFIAEFYTSPRTDGQDVAGAGGGAGTQNLHRLDSIRLFSRPDVVSNGPDNAVPIKTVYFDYDYALCNGSPGAAAGKLTLKEVYFRYGKSNLKRFSRYIFNYDNNPTYHPQATDRWGTYKAPDPALPNDDFPYSPKTKTDADDYAGAWLLSSIETPADGLVTVEYEADDYAFVQDRRAMDMFPVLGFSETPATAAGQIGAELYDPAPRRYLYFQMKEAATNETVSKYLRGIEELYFRANLEVTIPGINEDVSGFIPVDLTDPANYGVTDFDPTIGWIRLPLFGTDGKDEPTDEGSVHPITKATAQQLAKQLPKVAYGLGNAGPNDFLAFFEAVLKNMGGFLANVLSFSNFITEFVGDGRGRTVDTSKTFIRLNTPDGFKFGGGARVKRILINDGWDGMTGRSNTDFTYGQEYSYTTTANINGTPQLISSGVAAYEPLLGGDENPFVEPARYHIDKKLASDVNDFSILPVNEAHFPAPNVGYSRIRVRNLTPSGVERTATGWVVQEFYTAKDFPTLVQLTPLRQSITKPIPNPFLHRSFATTSQGYSIELNDMHGKPKSRLEYAETNPDVPISGVRYFYKTDPENSKRLNNIVATLDPESGTVSDQLIGVEYEVVVDARQSSNTGTEGGAQVNVDVALTGPLPVVTASGYPQISRTEVRYRSIVANKVIMRSGILDRTEVFDKGSRLISRNELYDGTTGEVLILGSEEKFGDFRYSTNLPAHWMYPGMGPAFENMGLRLNGESVTGGILNISNAPDLFRIGDELAFFPTGEVEAVAIGEDAVTRPAAAIRVWALDVFPNSVSLIDANGQPIDDTGDLQLTRSGKRNLLSSKAGTVVTGDYPVTPAPGAPTFNFERVLDATAQEFDTHWQSYLGFHIEIPENTCSCTDATDLQGYPLRLALRDFIASDVLNGLPNEGARPMGFYSNLLEGDFNESSTVFHYTNHGSLVEVIATDTITNNSCTITIASEDGSTIPDIVSASDPTEWLPFDTYSCDGTNRIRTVLSGQGQVSVNVPVIISTDCLNFLDCTEVFPVEFPDVTCGISPGAVVNPFTTGIYGNWRAEAAYRFLTDRGNSGILKEQGYFEDFYPFFNGTASDGPAPVNGVTFGPAGTGSEAGSWQEAAKSEVIDPFGRQLQSRDALGIPSASVYGYFFQLPIAMAQRSHHQDIAFDGFEDYDFINVAESPFDACTLPAHWRLPEGAAPVDPGANVGRDLDEAHSGQYALRLEGETTIERDLFSVCDPDSRTLPSGTSYSIQDCDLIRNFSPSPGQYWLSAWVKETSGSPVLDTAYEKSSIEVEMQIGATTLSETFNVEGLLVDGWQQINGVFTVPDDANLSRITIKLNNPVGDGWVSYFDDIRLQPYNAVMNTYVYDPISLRLAAVLDERNFATFYEYDDEGNLARTEKETEDGRITVQEVRSSTPQFKKPTE